MKRQFLFACAILGALSVAAAAQEGAPNEGQVQGGPRMDIQRNIEFARAGGKALQLDFYLLTPAAKPSPVVVWIGDGQPRSSTPAAALVTPGYAVASIDTRAGSDLASQLADAKAAIRWLRANAKTYNLDGAHIAAMGFGRGGEIAALLGTTGDAKALEGDEGNADQSSRVQAIIDLAGPMDKGAVNPVAYVTKDSAPVLIIHGTADNKVSTQESQKFVSTLKVAGASATLNLEMGAGHDVGQLLSTTQMQSVVDFLNRQLKGVRPAAGLSSFLSTPLTEYVDPVALDLGGTLYRTYPTPVRGPNTIASYRVYLPPGYQASGTRRYPVIYFLHGSLVDSKRPITSLYIARIDAAIRSGVMPPTIVVLPQSLNQGRYVDSRDGTAPMESVLTKNLIPYIDAHYRTIAKREGRAIEGHSMGGYGALHIGFNNPDLFIAVTGNSPGGATLDYGEAPAAGRIDAFKIVYGSDKDYFIAMAPTTLAEKNAAKLRQEQIRIITGTKDALNPGAHFVHDALVKLNIPHEFRDVPESPHNHDQLLQYETFDTMAFYGKVFGKLSVASKAKAP